jgi:hypothetical protein
MGKKKEKKKEKQRKRVSQSKYVPPFSDGFTDRNFSSMILSVIRLVLVTRS